MARPLQQGFARATGLADTGLTLHCQDGGDSAAEVDMLTDRSDGRVPPADCYEVRCKTSDLAPPPLEAAKGSEKRAEELANDRLEPVRPDGEIRGGEDGGRGASGLISLAAAKSQPAHWTFF